MTQTPLTDFLPDWLRDYVTGVAQELQVPEDAVAVLALGAVASAVNGGANTKPNKTWVEPVVLYTLALLPSGEGKSPVFARLLDPVLRASDAISGNQTGDLNEQKTRNHMLKMREAQIVRETMKAVADGDIDLDDAIAHVTRAKKRLHAPRKNGVTPVRVLTDATPAAIVDALGANEGRIVVASPEADALLGLRGGALDVMLKGYDGELLRQGRRTIGEITIKRPVINMAIAMQPAVLGSLGVKMVNRGFMPRFLITIPQSLVGRRRSRSTLVPVKVSKAYNTAIYDIVARFAHSGTPQVIRWTAAAYREVITWRDEIEPQMTEDGRLAPIGAWANKIRGAHFIRVAALLAIMDGKTLVSVDHARRAKGILRLLINDAVQAFSEMGASFAVSDVVHLMGIVNDELHPLPATFAKRDIMRRSNRFMKDKDRCAGALAEAVREGYLVEDLSGRTPVWTAVG